MKHRKLLVVFATLAAILACAPFLGAAALDLSALSGDFVLADNRVLITGPKGEKLLISTNGSRTYVAVMRSLEGKGEAERYSSYVVHYRRAMVAGESLYLLGEKKVSGELCPVLCRIKGENFEYCFFPGMQCDYTRRFEVRENTFAVVTAPMDENIGDETPLSVYALEFGEAPLKARFLFTESQALPESSAAPDSSTPVSSAPEPPKPPAVPWASDDYHIFARGITRAELQKEYDLLGGGGQVLVTAPDGDPVMRAGIYTGCLVEVRGVGLAASRVVAVVTGELCATPALGESLFCTYLTGNAELTEAQRLAADMDGNGEITVSDLLACRTEQSKNDLEEQE